MSLPCVQSITLHYLYIGLCTSAVFLTDDVRWVIFQGRYRNYTIIMINIEKSRIQEEGTGDRGRPGTGNFPL